jgi:hypothetical protein
MKAVPIRVACVLLPLLLPATLCAATAIGDWGHFVLNRPRVFLNNPEGKAFTVTVHVMGWPVADWNKPDVQVALTGPDGKAVLDGPLALTRGEGVVNVPAGAKGVYRLQLDGVLWVSSSLDESVLWTGDPTKRHNFRERFAPAFQMVVPRQWWFWVPQGVTHFTCKVQRSSEYMSQREAWGIFIVTPRGQRIRALWGQPPRTPPADYLQDMVAEVEVEPGASGRFWALQLANGDSHNYSKPNVCLDGVPPYIARSPEEWFDPETGGKPQVKVYDDEPFIQSARIEDLMASRWPNLQHFSPCPSLGDPDGVQMLGDGRFALWNPDGRDLRFRIGTYLPRKGKDSPETANVEITGPDGKTTFKKTLPMLHIHEADGQPTDTLKTGKGVSIVSVTGPERWFSFTYPATPVVLLSKDIEGGWHRFRFTAGTPRNWYFFVPAGTREFTVRAAADDPDDVMHFEVCSPDRTMALIYDRAGEKTVKVPDGLAGKMWYLRPDVGSATQMVARPGTDCRYQETRLTVDLKGVPGCLAPTWEQWFDPSQPVSAPGRQAGHGPGN